MFAIARNCKLLKLLDIQDCPHITEKAVKDFKKFQKDAKVIHSNPLSTFSFI